MTGHLSIDDAELTVKGGINTADEISRQPEVWMETYRLVLREKDKIRGFLSRALAAGEGEIILTGAGSSAFIGNSLQGPMLRNLNRNVRTVPTTDLVSHPGSYLRREVPTLLISFARSGDSPESFAAVERAKVICGNLYHLVITCNPSGELARNCKSARDHLLLLPSGTNDLGLAMTASFTSMLLAGILISKVDRLGAQEEHVGLLSRYGKSVLVKCTDALHEVAKMDFKRAVFLGSGPLQGIAQESQLKLQELTAGRIICKHDSFLGFRHGPRAVVDDATLLVYLLSNDPQVLAYEMDLIREVRQLHREMFSLSVSEHPLNEIKADLEIVLSEDEQDHLPEEFLAITNVLPAQMLGFFKSFESGLRPDAPSADGAIHRVVQGVRIYPYDK